jgi:hypothetical protein
LAEVISLPELERSELVDEMGVDLIDTLAASGV